MELHRSGKKADWLKRPRRQWNMWQRWAGDTGGVITPGNVITLVGFGLVLAGLAMVLVKNYWPAAILMFVGRCFDLLDGWVAQRTGTKSPLGEKLDAGFDKLITGLAIITLVVADIIPWWLALAIAIPHLGITIVSIWSARHGQRIHPTKSGKYSMAVAWLALGAFVLVRTLEAGQALESAAYGVSAIAIVMATQALVGYVRAARQNLQ